MLGTLLLSGAVNVLAGSVFAYVGLRFVLRRTSQESQLANQAFAAYWVGLGAYTALHGVLDVGAALGHAPFALHLAVRYASLPLLVTSVASGTFYFAYLFTGRQAWAWPILGFFALTLTAASYYVTDREPVGVAIYAWRTDLAYAAPYESAFFNAILLGLALPPIVGSALYLRLRHHAPDAQTRRRVTLVGLSIFLWSIGAVLARLASDSTLLEWISRPVLGTVVAITVLRAYRPSAPARGGVPPDDHARLRALDERVAQLV